MHIAVELERMADHALRIARVSLRLGDAPLSERTNVLRQIQLAVCQMTHASLDAYMRIDAPLARVVAARDEEIDQLCRSAVKQALAMGTPGSATSLFTVLHALERIGDRATNICERVVFVGHGRIEPKHLSVTKY